MCPRAVVMWFGFGLPGALSPFFLAAVGCVLGLVIKILPIEFVVLAALAFLGLPLLVGIREDAAMIAEIKLAAVALPNGLR